MPKRSAATMSGKRVGPPTRADIQGFFGAPTMTTNATTRAPPGPTSDGPSRASEPECDNELDELKPKTLSFDVVFDFPGDHHDKTNGERDNHNEEMGDKTWTLDCMQTAEA